jgi:hypothetical protein
LNAPAYSDGEISFNGGLKAVHRAAGIDVDVNQRIFGRVKIGQPLLAESERVID